MSQPQDKIIHFEIAENTLFILTESGKMYRRELKGGARWTREKLPGIYKKSSE